MENEMQLSQNKKCAFPGFSLMEVLIVIFIIALMTMVGVVSLSNARSKKQLETETRKVVAAIKAAQNNALTGKTPQGFPCNYTFSYGQNGNNLEYKIIYSYKDSPAQSCTANANSRDHETHLLENGVSFPSGGSFSFTVPFGKPNVGNFSVTLRNSQGDMQSFCVCPSGAILEDGDTTDCQAACQAN